MSGSGSLIRFRFTCKRCGSILEAADSQSQQQATCPTCGAMLVVPAVDPRTGVATGPSLLSKDDQLPTPLHAYANAGDRAPKIRRRDDGRQVIVCPRCAREAGVEADSCPTCGVPFTLEGAAETVLPEGERDRWATASLVLGVLSVLTFCFPVMGVAAIGTGMVALRRIESGNAPRSSRSGAWGGIICGTIAIAAFAAWMLAR